MLLDNIVFLQDKGSTFISQLYYDKFDVSDMTDISYGPGDQTLKLLLYRFECSADWSKLSVQLDKGVLQEQNSRFSSQCCKTKQTMLYSVRNWKLEASGSFFVWKIVALGMFSKLEKCKMGDRINTHHIHL